MVVHAPIQFRQNHSVQQWADFPYKWPSEPSPPLEIAQNLLANNTRYLFYKDVGLAFHNCFNGFKDHTIVYSVF